MKFKSTRKQNVKAYSTTSAAAEGGSQIWDAMAGHTFSAGEVRTIQLGYILIAFAVLTFAILAQNVLVPAFKSRTLRSTDCRVLRSEIVNGVNTRNSKNSRCQSPESNLCLKVHVLYETKESREAIEYSKSDAITSRTSWSEYLGFAKKIMERKPEVALTGHPIQVIRAIVRYNELENGKEPCTLQIKCAEESRVATEQKQRRLFDLHRKFSHSVLKVQCFYDPTNFSYVILKKQYDETYIWQCILWPGLFFCMGMILIVIVQYCIGPLKLRMNECEKTASKTKDQIRLLNSTVKTSTIRRSSTNRGTMSKSRQRPLLSAGGFGAGNVNRGAV